MAHAHFGNLADVFKHLALAEIIGAMRPGEYWESHAGSALNAEQTTPPEERIHGIHTFIRLAAENEALRCSLYYRVLMQVFASASGSTNAEDSRNIPGSPMLARCLMSETSRRLLFCDTDAESLNSTRTPLRPPTARQEGTRREMSAGGIRLDKIECVQDDGVSVLRGAGMLLSEQWTASTLVFIDPDEMDAATDADISPLQLACELATRGIATVLWYGFADEAQRLRRHQALKGALEKSRLQNKGAQRFEGSLKKPAEEKSPTQWGWGILTLNVPTDALGRITLKLRALESLYEKVELSSGADSAAPAPLPGSGAWKLVHSAM